ncbi:uncharacterized protein LOC114251258 [Bombyx mandarina]|uniref:Uncharacterized protein LOC114251258 n=1 Tax=Bombyx mandarina TaxID=7092 RepID=A0A6J2KI79_BOMMA|nr:uncharacterized protein LOC114251258 [Bombyx mandarina]
MSMQRLLDLLPQWLDRWKVAVNVGKTAALLHGPVRIRVVPKKLNLRGVNIEFKPKFRYLGCDIDRSLSMAAHASQIIGSASAARFMLRPRFRLQAQQNLSLRNIVGAGRYVRNDVFARDLDVESLMEFVIRLSRNMYERAENSPHEHLHNIGPLHARPPDGKALPREILVPPTIVRS